MAQSPKRVNHDIKLPQGKLKSDIAADVMELKMQVSMTVELLSGLTDALLTHVRQEKYLSFQVDSLISELRYPHDLSIDSLFPSRHPVVVWPPYHDTSIRTINIRSETIR